jgi:hypothetical protein
MGNYRALRARVDELRDICGQPLRWGERLEWVRERDPLALRAVHVAEAQLSVACVRFIREGETVVPKADPYAAFERCEAAWRAASGADDDR